MANTEYDELMSIGIDLGIKCLRQSYGNKEVRA